MHFLPCLSLIIYGVLAAAKGNDVIREPESRRGTANCSSLHIIVARASGESQTLFGGEGMLNVVAQSICNVVSDCSSYGVVYPSTAKSYDNYLYSEPLGVAAMTSAIHSYYDDCPQTPIVLMGYSQGAQVVGDTLCGTSEKGWPSTTAISGPATNNIIAVIQMADPSYVTGRSSNVGTATKDGMFPRLNFAACDRYAGMTQAYCDYNDRYCSSGDSIAVHVGYVKEYGSQAVRYVVSKYSALATSTTATPNPTATATAVTTTASSSGAGPISLVGGHFTPVLHAAESTKWTWLLAVLFLGILVLGIIF